MTCVGRGGAFCVTCVGGGGGLLCDVCRRGWGSFVLNLVTSDVSQL